MSENRLGGGLRAASRAASAASGEGDLCGNRRIVDGPQPSVLGIY